jgi:hypothetical protein
MSARRSSSRLLVSSISALVVGLVLWLTPAVVRAQSGSVPEAAGCSNPPPSSCITCHTQADPIANQGEWHVVHARNDFCRNCHGGDDRTMDKDQAHIGVMRNPLGDTYLSCHQCHPEDYQQRAEKFAVVLGVTSHSNEPITTTLALNPSSGAPAVRMPAAPTSGLGGAGAWGWFALIAVIALALLGATLTLRKLPHSK